MDDSKFYLLLTTQLLVINEVVDYVPGSTPDKVLTVLTWICLLNIFLAIVNEALDIHDKTK